jgi:methionine aminopeptidase
VAAAAMDSLVIRVWEEATAAATATIKGGRRKGRIGRITADLFRGEEDDDDSDDGQERGRGHSDEGDGEPT